MRMITFWIRLHVYEHTYTHSKNGRFLPHSTCSLIHLNWIGKFTSLWLVATTITALVGLWHCWQWIFGSILIAFFKFKKFRSLYLLIKILKTRKRGNSYTRMACESGLVGRMSNFVGIYWKVSYFLLKKITNILTTTVRWLTVFLCWFKNYHFG